MKKWAAAEAAMRVRRVRAVANEIEVRLSASGERTDADIAADARRALEYNILVPADKIKLAVSHGMITLQGDADWYYQKEEAERTVRNIRGVRGHQLDHREARVEASELKRKIEEAIVRNAKTDAERITIEVQGNKVVLTGIVHSWAEKQEAERSAWSAPGVTAVENRIIVESF